MELIVSPFKASAMDVHILRGLFLMGCLHYGLGQEYVPGTPGARWTSKEVDIVRQKVLEIIDNDIKLDLNHGDLQPREDGRVRKGNIYFFISVNRDAYTVHLIFGEGH